MSWRTAPLLLAIAVAVGCAAQSSRPVSPSPAARAATPASQHAEDPRAFLPLDEIEPDAKLPAARATTQPTSRPSLDAVELFARARTATLENQRYNAINLLEKAIALDPDSFELYYALGRAYLAGNTYNDQAIAAMEKAAAIEPDRIEVQTSLGRQFLARGDFSSAIRRLKLAMQTSQYATDDGEAAEVDFFLARALQQQGYDRAALDSYSELLRRIRVASLKVRQNPELAFLLNRPDTLYLQIGLLYEKHGEFEDALSAYEPAAAHDPGNFELQSRVVRCLLGLGRYDEARRRAADVVIRFHANAESISLLKETLRKMGREDASADELMRLHRQRPDDRAILFALVETLQIEGQASRAQDVLRQAIAASPDDFTIVHRLFDLYESQNNTSAAAKLLIENLAANPDTLHDSTHLWAELIRPDRPGRLRIPQLQQLEVPESVTAAKLYWVSRLADLWHRDALARTSLEQAVSQRPPFPPAFRLLMGAIWTDDRLDNAGKTSQSKALIDAASSAGDASLAAELRGLSMHYQKEPAVEAFAEAVKLGGRSPDLQLNYAVALRDDGSNARSEQILWKLVSDFPSFDEAYMALFNTYADRGNTSQAVKVVTTWLAADPTNINAQLLQAGLFARGGRVDLAEAVVDKLFAQDDANDDVLSAMATLYTQSGRTQELIDKLSKKFAAQPQSRSLLERLMAVYLDANRPADAAKALDAARAAVASDPDLLYSIAHLYSRIDQKNTTDAVLEDVVKIDPAHASASNDLGYSLADRGLQLDRAEALIRVAVLAEPDNQSFLDSLGWVLYKRGKFEEARVALEEAIGPAGQPDPVVLDHLGDALYRLSRVDEAAKMWQRSLDRLAVTPNADRRDDLRQLRQQLETKLKQAKAGTTPIDVAPVALSS